MRVKFMRRRITQASIYLSSLLSLVFLTPKNTATAASGSEVSEPVLFQSINVLVNYFGNDLGEISEISRKVSIVHYSQSEKLPANTQEYLIKKIEEAGSTKADLRIVQCVECLSLKAEAKGEDVYVSKGIASESDLKARLADLQIKHYFDINLSFSGHSLILQATLLDASRTVAWSRSYETPVSSMNDSQWQLGLSLEAMSFTKPKFPSPGATRIFIGQRLFGLGYVGLAGTFVQKTPSLASIRMYTGYFEMSHNEFFNSYWNYVQLLYLAEIGITDFNAKQQLTESFGVKGKFGQHFTLRLAYRMHQFFKKPQDSGSLYNESGEAILQVNQALPPQIILGVGVEL